MHKSDWSSSSSISSSSTLTLCTTNARGRPPPLRQSSRWIAPGSQSSSTDPVLLIALLELESVESESNVGVGNCNSSCVSSQRFVTKLRIRASEVRTTLSSRRRSRHSDVDSSSEDSTRRSVCSSDSVGSISSQNCKYWIFTAAELRCKIRQYFAAVPSAASSSSSWGYDVFITANAQDNYSPLPHDDSFNIVAHYGTRWRIRLRERLCPDKIYVSLTPEVAPKHDTQGPKQELHGVPTVSFQSKTPKIVDLQAKHTRLEPSREADPITGSGLSFARYLARDAKLVQGKRVLALGACAGNTLLGLSAAMLGAEHVTVVDQSDGLHPLQGETNRLACLVKQTIDRSDAHDVPPSTVHDYGDKLCFQSFDWKSPDGCLDELCTLPHDVVLFDDCLDVDRALFLSVLQRLLGGAAVVSRRETTKQVNHTHTSPVNSWSDIYLSQYRSTDWSSSKIRSTADDLSYCTLHEPPPEDDVLFRSSDDPERFGCSYNGHMNSALKRSGSLVAFDGLDDEEDENYPVSPQCVARLILRQPTRVPTMLSLADAEDLTPSSPRNQTRVFFSYMCHDEATHDSFKKALVDLFCEVDVLVSPTGRERAGYYLLSCQGFRC